MNISLISKIQLIIEIFFVIFDLLNENDRNSKKYNLINLIGGFNIINNYIIYLYYLLYLHLLIYIIINHKDKINFLELENYFFIGNSPEYDAYNIVDFKNVLKYFYNTYFSLY